MSLLLAMAVRLLTLLPVYTASNVSNELPTVSIVTGLAVAAVQRYQIERPPALPAWLGSPLSFVAFTLLPLTVPETPLMLWALAKASLAGGGGGVWIQLSVTFPEAPLKPSTAIW